MKKLTLLFTFLFAVIMSFANQGEKRSSTSEERIALKKTSLIKHSQGKAILKSSTKKSNSLQRTNQAPFFSEVFAGGIPPTWQNIDSSGSGAIWTWTTSGTTNQYPGLNDSLSTTQTSANNGYLIFDSDAAGTTSQGNYGVLITDPIDCSAHSSVRITFNEYFTKFNSANPHLLNTARVYLSTDGTTWTMIHSADTNLVNSGETANPEVVDLNISSLAAGEATVYLKFSYTGDFSYWWFVDDLELSEVSALDAGMFGISDPFNGCLLSSTENIVVGVLNNGIDSLHDIPVFYSVNGGVPVSEIITDTIAPGASLIYTFNQTADLSTAAVYIIVSYVAFPGDITSNNDTFDISTRSHAPNMVLYTMGFEASDDYSGYAVEDVDGDGETIDVINTYSRSGLECLRFPVPVSAGTSDNWVISSCFDFSSLNVYSVSLWHKLFNFASLDTAYTIEVYIGTSQDISSMNLLTTLQTPSDTSYNYEIYTFNVPSDGLYYLALRAHGEDVTISSRIDDITVDFASSVNDLKQDKDILVYPNPSNGKIFITNKNLGQTEAKIRVLNAIGQVLATTQTSNFLNETIDLSTQPNGLYSVQVQTPSGVITKMIMLFSN